MDKKECILTIYGSTRSIKFSIYKITEPPGPSFYEEIENIGFGKTKSSYINSFTGQKKASRFMLATTFFDPKG
ncbi:MAG: hypothetical protein ABI472_24130 [Ginsengibacter sp.]